MNGDPDIVVLRGEAHGIPISEYATALRERLPEYDIEHAKTPQQERELVVDAPIITGGSITEELLDRAEKARLYAAGGAGVGPATVRPCIERGLTVTNASIHGPNIAEYVLGTMLGFSRNLYEGMRRNQRREWRHFQARDFTDSTVTVVGLGAIGTAIVQRLSGFEVETIGVRYTPEKGGPTDEVVGFETDALHEALARTDYLALACPLTETTRGLIDAEALSVLPPDAVLVNISRGQLVETDALVSAIRQNQLRGAALDVTDPEPLPEDHPLWNFENVLVTPHMSGHTPDYWVRCAELLTRNVRRIEETGEFDDLENTVELTSDGEVVFT
ncbi:D-2-hydroxyacid dehydrogenase [Saliphagus infecundisoli]|uniref:D-2-hydroxyacid dehydrogenase n=1 Tax=Saliphagus infecundisoli TaxID=1849069 RepID=A0ABD5QCQ1_9EURY|nr:D-2-hydroxyacid dehydrogenase [Saliphagus infecundisoli]